MPAANDPKDPEFDRAIQTLESMRNTVERNFRDSQETGDASKANMARQKFLVRMRSIQASQPQAYAEWLKGNARFLRAVEEGRNPIIC
jgi:NAD-dependent DNA ligase